MTQDLAKQAVCVAFGDKAVEKYEEFLVLRHADNGKAKRMTFVIGANENGHLQEVALTGEEGNLEKFAIQPDPLAVQKIDEHKYANELRQVFVISAEHSTAELRAVSASINLDVIQYAEPSASAD